MRSKQLSQIERGRDTHRQRLLEVFVGGLVDTAGQGRSIVDQVVYMVMLGDALSGAGI